MDAIARTLGEKASRSLGHPFVIDNKPGAGGNIGADLVAKSPADGYTIMITSIGMATNKALYAKLNYDPVKDFAPVSLLAVVPNVLVTNKTQPDVRTLADVIAPAKAKPGEVAIATEGPKTFSGMLADSVAGMAGVRLNHVPYTKAPDALQDVLGGRVQLVCLPDAALTSYLQAGTIRALAVSTGKRVPGMPDVPSLSETFAGFDYAGWNGLFAPAGTPADIISRVNRDVEAVLQQPEAAQRLQFLGSQPEHRMSVAEFDTFMRSERERWARLVKQLDIQPE